MGAQVGILSGCQFASLDGLAYTGSGRNLKTWWNFEDFGGGHSSYMGLWIGGWNGAGAVFAIYSPFETGRPGVRYGGTGTTAAGYAYTRISDYDFLLSGMELTFETDIQLPILSAVAEEYVFQCGFGDVMTADQVDGVYFSYNRLGTGVNWRLCTANNSARTNQDSGVAVSAAAWIRLKIVVNAAGTLATYYINGVVVGTVATNLPGAGRSFGVFETIYKSAGLTDRDFLVDWAWTHMDLTTSR